MSRRQAESETALIIDTLADGRGVADTPGKKVFVDGALTGETVRFRRARKKRNFDEAELLEVLESAPERIKPRCAAFGICGGCSLQHLSGAEQLRIKQTVLLDNLQRIGTIIPQSVLPPIEGHAWGYRRKARLAIKNVVKKGRVLVGFRERHKPYVADMNRCETLHPAFGERLDDLSELIGRLSIRDRLPQIECAVGDHAAAMIFRVLEPPSQADIEALSTWSGTSGVQVFLQTGGPDTVVPLPGHTSPDPLHYRVPEYDVTISFTPADFLQVHAQVNQLMIKQAIDLLAPDSSSSVLDLYCGLGNFSLPLARVAGQVLGIELTAEMVARARDNARACGLDNVEFRQADLSKPVADLTAGQSFDLVLLDPPRTGMAELLDTLIDIRAKRILYVSCHPGTLARDAQRLVNDGGYRLVTAGIMDMFPQTSHVESMALFQR
ncbi:MAG: 23S rRNA (uracil(1939)-C(5))-methyltransferase RlmD [Gammaproteobacteria bacterium]|jgi:23S rRNA (uracil1939-C5)-methyltransferase|nr:23S rRNA (uracil(1939)-C(5))-methyltransferase RlmD [Gammaproteobacteria bacterium]MDP7153090.1 23S rRNA (uracil(1939)-C(5))-methyltransferase RlmD [Gammaproteobacteria bacterium]MDP7297599.1 23S rRNA (uracil(1939)-C(5))-methyltransferase RlmD [Gammaproteobacteria bacterium]MDP7419619.1 23S rRNA (uracil(1939)-C(5))-methyltransferase RlmD [Gammaproteobacteria bacterium]MDP7659782.1 23S rRNA (uracil(1939)-C(5))-methyltransferase RlmD [Gammaproteobacteria bacterium]